MQKILSTFVLREYRHYTPQQVEIFRRTTSRSQGKYSQSTFEPTAATKESNSRRVVTQSVETTEFQAPNQVQELGKAVQKVEKAVQQIKDNEHQRATSNITFVPRERERDQERYQQQKFDLSKGQKGHLGQLKTFRQKMQAKKALIKQGKASKNPQFNLKTFKSRLNYKMYNRDALPN